MKKTNKEAIGWREWVALPQLGIRELKAKVDTGARSSALHAVDIEEFERDGALWVRFNVPVSGAKRSGPIETLVADRRDIKNTSGIADERYVVLTRLVLGNRRWQIEVSLADRENMGFDLILGRTAIRRRRLVVDAGRSFLAGRPQRHSRP